MIVVKLKGSDKFERMTEKNIADCLRCSFSMSFAEIDYYLKKGNILTDSFGNSYKHADSANCFQSPLLTSRGGSNTKKREMQLRF